MAIDPFTELSACLALVKPSGMTDSAVTEWLSVAAATVAHLPPVAFKEGCAKARAEARFPSDIVPLIMSTPTAKMVQQMDAISKPFLADHSTKRPAKLANDNAAQRLIEQAARDIESR